MGILDKIFSRSEHGDNATRSRRVSVDDVGLVKLSGTTTFCRDAISALAARYSIASGGYLELGGSLQRESTNAADPNAVAVIVEGERIGYLPGYATSSAQLSETGARSARVQVFMAMMPKGLRAEAWAWIGDGHPRWEWSESNPPPMSSSAKAQADQTRTKQMVQEAIEEGGLRAAQFRAGMVNGVHYLELIEPIKQLKREGRLEEALVLCYAAIEGAEGDRDGREPAPFYTEQAAIVLRKLGRRDEEIAVLNRWLELCPPDHREETQIGERLKKLK